MNHDTRSRGKNAPVDAPATWAVCWNRNAAVEALNERRIELALSLVELDGAAGLTAGTTAKYLCPGRVKGLGVNSLFKIARGLGLRIVLEVDHRATAALLEQSRPRQSRQARPKNFAQKCGKRTLERATRHLALTCDWDEILKIVGSARAKIATEQAAAKTAKTTGHGSRVNRHTKTAAVAP
jgi:hypothetical protein